MMAKDDFYMHRRADLLIGSTPSEDRVCQVLKLMEINFIRQYPIKTARKLYFADIFLPEYRVVIEVDGGYHFEKDQKRLDKNRTRNINKVGFKVLRIKNSETYKVKQTIGKISNYLKKLK